MLNDQVSAIKVLGANCVATLYQHDIGGGQASAFGTGEYCSTALFTQNGCRDNDISSLVVSQIGASATPPVAHYGETYASNDCNIQYWLENEFNCPLAERTWAVPAQSYALTFYISTTQWADSVNDMTV
jgi:hypothetical protein